MGGLLAFAGIAHLTFAREEFQAEVPDWVPGSKDAVVVASGVVEIALGAAQLLTWRQPARAMLGAGTAAFFVAVFPGNLEQYTKRKVGFGLDTDAKRFARLVFQPPIIAAAWYGGDVARRGE